MAEEEDNKYGNELMGQDFLSKAQDNIDDMSTSGLYDKLAKLGAQQRIQPLLDDQRRRAVFQPVAKMVEDAEDQIATAMTAYTLANPEIDDSKVFDATSDLVTGTMTENNAKFKELNRKLGYMSPQNPDYAKTVQEIAKINETSVNLRNDNAKLLGIRNTIKELDVQEMSKGQTPGQQAMFKDILVGNKDNFQTIDGKLHWVNPSLEEGDTDKNISVESMSASGPMMADDAAFESHYNLMTEVKKTKAEDLTDQDLNYQVNTMFKSIGNDGLKSLIFDSNNADTESGNPVAYSKNGMMFNTQSWWNKLYNDIGVDPNSGKGIQIKNDIQSKGVMHNITVGEGDDQTTIRVKEHFRDWYSNSLKSVEKTGNGKPATKTNLNDPPSGDPLETKDGTGSDITPNPVDITEIAPPKIEGTELYQGQTGSGNNYGIAESPFAGITQYGWAPVTDPKNRAMSSEDHLFDYGGKLFGIGGGSKYVVETLTREYGKTVEEGGYGFSFDKKTWQGSRGDQLIARYKHPKLGMQEEIFEFDNTSDENDQTNAKALQAWMHSMIGWSASK